jgi:hypothetical protein
LYIVKAMENSKELVWQIIMVDGTGASSLREDGCSAQAGWASEGREASQRGEGKQASGRPHGPDKKRKMGQIWRLGQICINHGLWNLI